MSIQTEITRIQTDRNTMRTKLTALKLVTANATLDDIATAIDNMENHGAISANIKEGETYSIPKGYHDGTGTVSGVAGGGNYTLQSKTVTPTKSAQAITGDAGYYGLSDVTVNAIPDNYQDVTPVTAGAGDVLANKVIVDATGKTIAGTMPNNGAVTKVLDTTTTSYTVPKGYHDGKGTVKVVTETQTATPTKAVQTVSPTAGKVLSSVTVNPIPVEYIITTVPENDPDGSAVTADKMLTGYVGYADGSKVVGTMPNVGTVTETLGASEEDIASTSTTNIIKTYNIPKGYHSGSGSVKTTLEAKTVTPTKSTQSVTPVAGNTLRKVTVNPIPAEYIITNVEDATAAGAGHILAGKKAYVNGSLVTGSMPNNGAINNTMDGLTATSVSIPAGYTTGGTVSLTNDIETALAAI